MSKSEEKGPIEHLLSEEELTGRSIIYFLAGGSLILIAFFHVFTGLCGQFETYTQRQLCVSMLLVGTFLGKPLGRKSWQEKVGRLFIIDAVLAGIAVVCLIYFLVEQREFIFRTSTGTALDHFFGVLTILLVLEALRNEINAI